MIYIGNVRYRVIYNGAISSLNIGTTPHPLYDVVYNILSTTQIDNILAGNPMGPSDEEYGCNILTQQQIDEILNNL